MKNAIKLKTNDDLNKISDLARLQELSFWVYKQHGGKDPRIILTNYLESADGWWSRSLSVVVRKDSIYMSYSTTVQVWLYEEMIELLKQAQTILQAN